ncbi:hypothetical protein G6F55_013802 [Rhizopus delemar]|nr:hypothetical protein G6F55_013802 [Rhizopus delemar]
MERGDDHHFIVAGDAGELGVHLRAHVLEFDRIDGIPGLAVAFQGQVEQAPDDALFGRGEIPAFDARVVAAIAAEQAVDDQEHQGPRGAVHQEGPVATSTGACQNSAAITT